MKTRQEIKAIGKARFKSNYWNCVLALLLVTAVLGALSWFSGGEEIRQISGGDPGRVNVTLRYNAMNLITLLIAGPLNVGLNGFFVKNVLGTGEELTVTSPFREAFQNYPRKLGGSLWMTLFIFLWSLLLLIPGLIKTISYSMTQYILADCPEVRAKDALKLSMRMMNGHKWEFFVLLLSFIGWGLLTILTFGILEVFYVGPYRNSSFAAYYLEIKREALRTGAVTREQLDGLQPV